MKVIAYLHYTKNNYSEVGEFEFYPYEAQWSREKMFIRTLEIEVPDTDIPSHETLTKFLITGLKTEKSKILAETQIKIQEIEDRIQELLCLPNNTIPPTN